MAGQAFNVLPAHEVFASEDIPAGNTATGELDLPAHTLAATGLVTAVATVVVTLPAHELLARGAGTLRQTLPAHELLASGAGGVLGTIIQTVPAHALTAAAFSGGFGHLVRTLPAHRLSAAGIVGVTGSLDRTLPAHLLSARGLVGRVGIFDEELEAHAIVATGGTWTVGTAYLWLPAPALEAFGVQSPAEHWRTWVVNTRKMALTEYTNWEHNSYAVFRGRVLAADGDGVSELRDVEHDRGDLITAYWKTGEHDFETSLMKRVPRIYVGYASAGDLEFHTILPRDGTRKYLLQENGAAGTQLRRVPVGQGPKSTYWQFAGTNRAGADFVFDVVLVFPETLRRRIG